MGFELPDDPRAQGRAGYGNYDLVIKVLAQALKNKLYIATEQFTAADIYLGSHLGFGMEFGTIPKLEEFEKYLAEVTNRDAYRRANELDNELMPGTQEE